MGNHFNQFFVDNDITRHKSVAYTPQQNGVGERMNRTIMEKVRCMLSDVHIPNHFWVEATSTATHTINRSPCISIHLKTHEEKLKDYPPNISYLKSFGCLAFAHIKQCKLEPRALKCMFLGYPEGTIGFKLWNFKANKSIINRNVTFKEDEPYMLFNSVSNVDCSKEYDLNSEIELANINDKDLSSSELIPDPTSSAPSLLIDDSLQPNETNFETPIVRQINLNDYSLSRDRTRREIRTPTRFLSEDVDIVSSSLALGEEDELKSYQEATNGSKKSKWVKAMKEEMNSLIKNQTWFLSNLPPNYKVVACK